MGGGHGAGRRLLINVVNALLVLVAAVLLLHLARVSGLAQGVFPEQGTFPAQEELSAQGASASSAAQSGNLSLPADTLELHIIDVGQGESLLLRCGSESLLVDGGVYDRYMRIAEYLKKQGVSALGGVLNTHPHSDHYGALRMVMQRIPAGEFLSGSIPQELIPTDNEYMNLLEYLEESATPARLLAAGDSLTLGEAEITVLGPVRDYGELNEQSLVLRVVFGETAFMLTGDAGEASEKDIIANGGDFMADVLVVGHHGSSTSTSEEWLSAVRPRFAAISLGEDNDYGFPHEAVLRRLASSGVERILRTDLDGDIVFISDGEKVVCAAAR